MQAARGGVTGQKPPRGGERERARFRRGSICHATHIHLTFVRPRGIGDGAAVACLRPIVHREWRKGPRFQEKIKNLLLRSCELIPTWFSFPNFAYV